MVLVDRARRPDSFFAADEEVESFNKALKTIWNTRHTTSLSMKDPSERAAICVIFVKVISAHIRRLLGRKLSGFRPERRRPEDITLLLSELRYSVRETLERQKIGDLEQFEDHIFLALQKLPDKLAGFNSSISSARHEVLHDTQDDDQMELDVVDEGIESDIPPSDYYDSPSQCGSEL